MTPAYFINTECLTFQLGQLVVVSGADSDQIRIVLLQAQEKIVLSGKPCPDPFDTRTLVSYVAPTTERAPKFEYEAIKSQVTLIANQFDRGDRHQNPYPVDMEIDVIIDLLNVYNIRTINEATSHVNGGVRELFGYMSKVYWYDTEEDEIFFVKNQIPQRP